MLFRRNFRGRGRGRRDRSSRLRHRHEANQILTDTGLFQNNQPLHTRVEVCPRATDELQNEQFIESGLGQRHDIIIGQRLLFQLSNCELLSGSGNDY